MAAAEYPASPTSAMLLTYRYRLLPTRAQHMALARILESQRTLYNGALAERIDAYKRSLLSVERGLREKPHTITYFDQTNSLTQCRQDPLTRDEFSRVPAYLQHWTLKRLDDAYKAFFRRIREGKRRDAGFPLFRGRDRWDSFGFSQNGGFRLTNSGVPSRGARNGDSGRRAPGDTTGSTLSDGGDSSPRSDDDRTSQNGRMRLRIKGLPGGLRLHLHRPLPGDIGTLGHKSENLRSITITHDPGGRKWWVSISCRVDPQPRCQSGHAAVGVDVGVTKAIAQSDESVVPLPKTIKAARKTKTLRQRAMSRAIKGSKRREKTKLRLARLEAANTRRRKAWHHRQAAKLTRCYRVVGIEDLQVANMVRSAKGTAAEPGTNVKPKAGLNRSILEVGWAGLREKLTYKALRDGAILVAVPPAGTSQTCSVCGYRDADNRRSQAVFVCGQCGHRENADINAAKVIRARALAQVVPVSTGIRGLPQPEGANGDNGRRCLGNTAGASPLDGGGRSPASIPAPAQELRPAPRREPQASTRRRGGPHPRDDKQLVLPLAALSPEPERSAMGPRKRAQRASSVNDLQARRRTSYRDVE